MKFIRPAHRPLVGLLIKRSVLFFVFLSALTLFLYAVGTVQGFLDSTQMMLLHYAFFFTRLLIPLCLIGACMDLLPVLRRERRLRNLWGALSYLAAGAASAFVAAGVAFILGAVAGTGP